MIFQILTKGVKLWYKFKYRQLKQNDAHVKDDMLKTQPTKPIKNNNNVCPRMMSSVQINKDILRYLKSKNKDLCIHIYVTMIANAN